MTDRYAVVGNPIEQSKSPTIHKMFAEQCEEDLVYEKILIPLGEFDKYVGAFFEEGGKGLNITMPFKGDAFGFADITTERALLAEASNTLSIDAQGHVTADNTDGAGLVSDLVQGQGWELKEKDILIIGAGGAVRGVLLPLLQEAPRSITLANRTVPKAQALADNFAGRGEVCALSLEELNRPFDIVINGTSASLTGELPQVSEEIFSSNTCAYDMVYGREATSFMRWAESCGVQACADGIGMLARQAAVSFSIWRGKTPQVDKVIQTLRRVS